MQRQLLQKLCQGLLFRFELPALMQKWIDRDICIRCSHTYC